MAESSVARNMSRVRYVGSGEAARRLGVSRATILRAVRRGALPPAFRTPGGAHRFDVDDLAAYALRLALPSPAASSATDARAIADALHTREDAVRPSEARYRNLLESVPDAIVTVDGAGRIVLVNAQTEALFGYPRQTLLGQSVELLLPDSLRSTHRQHRAIYQADPHTRPMGSGLVLHARRRDGSAFPVEISLSPIPDSGERLVTAVVRDVSARQATEEALRASEAHFHTLVRMAPVGICILTERGIFEEVNASYAALLGYTPEELVGRHFQMVFPHAQRPAARAAFEQLLATGGLSMTERSLRHKDGSTRTMLGTSLPLSGPNGRLRRALFVVDIEERKRAEEARAWLAAIVAGSSDAIIGLALDRTIISWNAGAERLYGYPAREAIGRSVDLLAVPGHPDEVPQIREALSGGQAVVNLDTVRRHRDGRALAVSISISPVRDASGAVIGSAGIHRDITTRVRAEQAAKELAQLRSDFLEAVSHELRTPLTAMIGYAQMLRELWPTLDRERRERYLDSLVAAASRQRRLVQDLLDANEVESAEFQCERQPFALYPVLERAVAEVQESYRGQRMDVHGPDGVMVEGDAGRTQQILANLIDNAAKYSPEGSPVDVTWELEGREVVVRVRDRGPGIPDAGRIRLFTRFGRLRGSKMRAGRTGTGLGLYLSRTLARAMDGELDLERTGPRGSTFRLRLPSAPSD